MFRKLLLIIIGLLITAISFASKPDFTVAADGSGDFKTVQEAINAIPDLRRTQTVVYIKNGVYKEKLTLPPNKINVKFMGEDVAKVILTFDDYASKKNRFGEEIGTSGSASFFIYADNFTAEQITFQNSAGPVGQAVAVRVASDRVRFINCKFLGFQDTLYTYGNGAASRQYYRDCYIEGTTDFIFGAATAVFDRCRIYGKKGGQYLTAASTPDTSKYGYVFIGCDISGDAGKASYYLGRPWKPSARTVFIGCHLSDIIKPEGWHNWGKPDAEQTTFYAEYNNRGAGANTAKRVQWAHQLTEAAATAYQVQNILGGWVVGD
ncbi:pectinesterase family protein [Niabella soli]|uniref:Pectinesterase n=1 Tax=Niabella soli DSM 19437 TaxID=929713 RepID=W0F0X6_9BACT|nr:pectinesterase family protein [Niabella soli]AHF16652.1 pectin methylesterase [Niabella soli DSM 19437]